MIINSQIQLGPILKQFSQEELKNEPMFFNCDFEFALKHGNLPTKQFLMSLPSDLWNKNTIIDSRVHMLMPGWYPCIPGYHHDDVPRETPTGQPEYYNPSYRSKHAMILFNGDICPTEFALGESEFTEPNINGIVYKDWHEEVIQKLNKKQLTLYKAPSEQIIFFDDRTWHQGVKAVGNGFRLFIRASWDTGRKPTNEIRNQVQIYMENPNDGW